MFILFFFTSYVCLSYKRVEFRNCLLDHIECMVETLAYGVDRVDWIKQLVNLMEFLLSLKLHLVKVFDHIRVLNM